ncbi:MAG TPA: hypothetical protein VKM55_18370 [Candidatus Lokiarchaeia archaeon]|nr:hypothetical protein [Candidatus Lokiarchaeia archaeon]
MTTFNGKLARDSNGVLCLKLDQYSQISDLMNIPLDELFEEFCDNDVLLEITRVTTSTFRGSPSASPATTFEGKEA